MQPLEVINVTWLVDKNIERHGTLKAKQNLQTSWKNTRTAPGYNKVLTFAAFVIDLCKLPKSCPSTAAKSRGSHFDIS